MNQNRISIHSGERGSALIAAAVTTIIVAAMAGALLSVTSSSRREQDRSGEGMKALFVAEAAVNQALASLRTGHGVNLGSQANPVPFSDGSYWGTSVDNKDGTWTLTAYGSSQRATRGIEVVLTGAGGGVFSNALFAGNSSRDPLYELQFGGKATQADYIDGDVYSGGAIRLDDDAFITGAARAVGGLSGGGGKPSPRQSIPDIAGANYATNNDFDVASLFGAATYKANAAYGGSAWQLPEDSPAHIFRKNPSDRSSDTSKTAKDDYFLEDPYEAMSSSSVIKPSAGAKISLSGVGGKPGATGNDAVYYIDGNLWVHNRSAYSFTLDNPGTEPLRITFVVSGNVYYSDNVMYGDAKNDGLAIIAIKDPAEPDSGNIYFGDPVFGTLERMDSFMYAENDFYDTNLSAKGSASVTVNGNMTAGNHVRIDRDVGGQHSKLTVNFDGRISSGGLALPGLPQTPGSTPLWTLLSWREVVAP